MTHGIRITPPARQMLLDVSDRREREHLRLRIRQLAEEPEKQGKALFDDLAGYRSVRAVGQRYRIVYRVERGKVVVVVVALGRRRAGSKKDVYRVVKKLLRAGLLE
jgi:mRNA interferase RelE/StbE